MVKTNSVLYPRNEGVFSPASLKTEVGVTLKKALGLNVILEGLIQADEKASEFFGTDRNVMTHLEFICEDNLSLSLQRRIFEATRSFVKLDLKLKEYMHELYPLHTQGRIIKSVKLVMFVVSEEVHFRIFMHLPFHCVVKPILEVWGLPAAVAEFATAFIGIFVTAFFFTRAHTGNVITLQSRQHFKSGIVFGVAYELGGLLTATTTHVVYNTVQSIREGYADN